MQKRFEMYSNYHKSFDRAFNTRQDPSVLDVDNFRLPQLQGGDLVANPIPLPGKMHQRGEKDRNKNKNGNNMRDFHLKPVVLRGAKGLNLENNPRVRLPPINVNMQVKDLLTQDKISAAIKNDQEILRRANCILTNEAEIDSQGRGLRMKEYSILPPIGKMSRPYNAEKKKDKLTEHNGIERNKTDEVAHERKLGLQEALENLANDFDTLKEISQVEKEEEKLVSSKSDEKEKADTSALPTADPSLDTDKQADIKKTGKITDEVVSLDDLSKKKTNRASIKLPKAPPERAEGTKRRKNKYREVDQEEEHEREMIEWIRARGRRSAICEEIDVVYQDLAVIVKHNLLVQHLEEICIF